MMEVMRGDRRGLESSPGGAGRVLRVPVSKGGILLEVPWEMRGAEGSGVDRARATGAAASFGGCSFESAHGERETWEPGRCLRPFLQVHRVRALVGRRGEGAAEGEGCPYCPPSKHLPARVRLSSPH